MYFLGQAGNYRALDILRHTFALGLPSDVKRLEMHLAERYTAPLGHVALYGTGRSALTAALQATIPKHSKVVVTGLTCYAVVQAVKAADCVPIFADANEATLHYGSKELKAVLAKYPDIKAAIVQNNLGHPADIVGIEALAKQHQLVIIEDLAHSAGIKYTDGREAGTVGQATILSFGKGKMIDTIAGGALIIRDPTLPGVKRPAQKPNLAYRWRARFYPLFGATVRGLYRFNLGTKNLGKAYTAFLLKLHWIERSADAPLNLTVRPTNWQCKLALRQLQRLSGQPLREYYLVNDKAQVLSELAQHGFVMYDTWYDLPVAPERYYRQAQFPEAECPNAVRLASQIINLPNHYGTEAMDPARKIIAKYELKRQIAKEK